MVKDYKKWLEEDYKFVNTGNSNYLTLDNGEILHYNLNNLNKGFIEFIVDNKINKIAFPKVNPKQEILKQVKTLSGFDINLNDKNTIKFLSYLPICK